MSPFDLTVAAIAKFAKTVPGTVYFYFVDVARVFYELSVEASQEFDSMSEEHPEWFTKQDRRLEDSLAFVTEFIRIWDRHSHVLHYRNLEADRGNVRHQELR